jgi:hypothetical protein
MGAKGWSGARKATLIDAIMVQVESDHSEALEMNAALEPTYTVPGTDMTLKGDLAKVMVYHMTNVHRFNPSESRDNDGRIRLTPKQVKRCAKKLRRFMKRENLWGTTTISMSGTAYLSV